LQDRCWLVQAIPSILLVHCTSIYLYIATSASASTSTSSMKAMQRFLQVQAKVVIVVVSLANVLPPSSRLFGGWTEKNSHREASVIGPSLPSDCAGQCKNLFLGGELPVSRSPTVEWTTCHCDHLFCQHNVISNETSADGNLTEAPCQWSMLAIDALLDSLDESACDAAHVLEFFTDPYWERYQLTDWFKGVVFHQLPKDASQGATQQRWNAHKSAYKDSLADEYHKASVLKNVTWKNYDLLYKAVTARIQQTPHEKRPNPNTLVIHLRLGDVIDGSLDTVRDLLLDQKYFYRKDAGKPRTPMEAPQSPPLLREWNAYVRPLQYYSNQLWNHRLGSHTVESVVIMGSAHLGQLGTNMSAIKSCQYTKALQAYVAMVLPRANISLRLGYAPDDDVVFATQAEHYLATGGGFSHLIGTLQAMRLEEGRLSI
jgi:hypothetical protein